jgi:hypothetical protein
MADITGQVGTGNVASTLLLPDVANRVLQYEPDANPLTVLVMKMATRPTHNPRFTWHEQGREQRFDTTTAGFASGITEITVTNISYYAQHDLVKVPRTGELMYVSGVTAGTSTITVERGLGSGAAALNNGEELFIVSSAQPEGDTSKPARSSNPTEVANYTQIIRRPYDMTGTMRATATYTAPTEWTRRKLDAAFEWKKDRELAYWTGRPSIVTTGAHPRRTTGGVFYYVSTNITDMGGAMTETEFWGTFSNAFRYGNQNTKTLFASRSVVTLMNAFPQGKLEVVQSDNDTTYGLNVRRFVSPHGTVNVVTHNLFEGGTYGGYFVILDLDQIKRRVLKTAEENRELHDRDDIQENDRDGRKGEWFEESGLEFGLEKTHAIGKNITS